MKPVGLGWIGIVRLGLVQSALGAIVTLATLTLNRVMVVEEGAAAVIPAALIAWHYMVQLSRPHWGYGSDVGHRRSPWIVVGMGVLALGALLATDATLMLGVHPLFACLLALVAYSMIGAGVAAAGTSLLALLATRVAAARRPAAASITWIMMIIGIVVCASVSGAFLQPFSAQRLATVVTTVAGLGFVTTLFAVWGADRATSALGETGLGETGLGETASPRHQPPASFRAVIEEIRTDPTARGFTIFVFVSMLAYSGQELILEPYAGLVFHMSPGQTAQLTGLQHAGVLVGMILVGAFGTRFGDRKSLWMRRWTVTGCIGSATALLGLALSGVAGLAWLLSAMVLTLGLANGIFAVSAISSMMGLAGDGNASREGVRVGVWGAAQAGAFAIGGFLGATSVGVVRDLIHQATPAFIAVFCVEAAVFAVAALLAAGLRSEPTPHAKLGDAATEPMELSGAPG